MHIYRNIYSHQSSANWSPICSFRLIHETQLISTYYLGECLPVIKNENILALSDSRLLIADPIQNFQSLSNLWKGFPLHTKGTWSPKDKSINFEISGVS